MRIGDRNYSSDTARVVDGGRAKEAGSATTLPSLVTNQNTGGPVRVSVGGAAAAMTEATRRPLVPDEDRVNEILTRIQNGSYKVDFEKLARKMLDEERGD